MAGVSITEHTPEYWAKRQEKADRKYAEAHRRFKVYGVEDRKAQLIELESADMQDEINEAARKGWY